MMSRDDYRLPERPLEPTRQRCLECAECGAEIFSGETSVVWDGDRLCLDCACERVKDELDTDAFRRMMDRFEELFGFEAETEYIGGMT